MKTVGTDNLRICEKMILDMVIAFRALGMGITKLKVINVLAY